MFAGAKVSGAIILAWLLLWVPRSEGAESIRQQFDKIAEVALQKTGLDQIREINLSINTLLNTTHFFLKSPETDHWRSGQPSTAAAGWPSTREKIGRD